MKRKWIFADWKLPDQTDLNLIRDMGFTDAVLGIGDDSDGRFRCKYSTARIVASAEAVRALGVRVHLMSWVRRQKTFIDEMAAVLLPLCREADAATLMLDAEGSWHRYQGISAAAAAARVRERLRGLPCPLGVTGLSNLHKTVAPLLAVCDYGLGQAYSIWKPGGAHWSHGAATEPGPQQAASFASWGTGNKPLIMGLSNYWAARPARNGLPPMDVETSLNTSLQAAETAGANEVAYWSLKWLRQKSNAAKIARRITAAIPVETNPVEPISPPSADMSPDAAVQWLLVQLGFKLGNYGPESNGVDGNFGKKSQKALDAFRKKEGLPTGGTYDTADLTALVNRFRSAQK